MGSFATFHSMMIKETNDTVPITNMLMTIGESQSKYAPPVDDDYQ